MAKYPGQEERMTSQQIRIYAIKVVYLDNLLDKLTQEEKDAVAAEVAKLKSAVRKAL